MIKCKYTKKIEPIQILTISYRHNIFSGLFFLKQIRKNKESETLTQKPRNREMSRI